MPPLPADSIHARACKLKCEKILTRPKNKLSHFFPSLSKSPTQYKQKDISTAADVLTFL